MMINSSFHLAYHSKLFLWLLFTTNSSQSMQKRPFCQANMSSRDQVLQMLSFIIYYTNNKSRSSQYQHFIQVSNCSIIGSHFYLTQFTKSKLAQKYFDMATRALSARKSRWQLSRYKQSPSLPKIIKHEPVNEKQAQKKQTEAKRKMNQLLNLQKYPYSRAAHYFFNLDEFPRSPSTVSYAEDNQNGFKWTFSKDEQIVSKSKIGDLINRKLIGLPINLTGQYPSRKEIKSKNVCFAYLFQIEDKKHFNDRIIYTIKLLLKRIQKMRIGELQRFDFIKKDKDLRPLLSEKTTLTEKKIILRKKIQNLNARKAVNRINWLFDDTVLFYHANNQLLHNTVIEFKSKLTEQHILFMLRERQQLQYHFFHSSSTLEEHLAKMTRYYYTNHPTLSQNKMRSLIAKSKTYLVSKELNGKFSTNYPLLLHFGRDENIQALTEFLIGRRAYSMGQMHFYQIKLMMKKLFGRDLKVNSQKITSYDQFYKNFRKKYNEISQWKKKFKPDNSEDRNFIHPLLEEKLNHNACKGSRENLFKLSESVQLTKKQYMFVMIYFWLTQSIASIYEYLIKFPGLIEIIGSDFFSKVCNSVVSAIGTPLTGFIYYIFEALSDLMSKSSQPGHLNVRLLMQYDNNLNTCMIWQEQTLKKSQIGIEVNISGNIARKRIKNV